MKKVRTYKIKSENQKCKPFPIEKQTTVKLPLIIRVIYLGTYVKKTRKGNLFQDYQSTIITQLFSE